MTAALLTAPPVWIWSPVLAEYVRAACEKSPATERQEPTGQSFSNANCLKKRQSA